MLYGSAMCLGVIVFCAYGRVSCGDVVMDWHMKSGCECSMLLVRAPSF